MEVCLIFFVILEWNFNFLAIRLLVLSRSFQNRSLGIIFSHASMGDKIYSIQIAQFLDTWLIRMFVQSSISIHQSGLLIKKFIMFRVFVYCLIYYWIFSCSMTDCNCVIVLWNSTLLPISVTRKIYFALNSHTNRIFNIHLRFSWLDFLHLFSRV